MMTSPLRFRPDGTFRVLMMSDIQESAHYDPRSLRSVEVLLDESQPDLVIWGGDNCYGPAIQGEADLKAFLDVFTAPMIERRIPWAHVYGNHDGEMPLSIPEQQAVYESFPNCLSKAGDEELTGVGNYVVPLYGSQDDEVKFVFWGLDSGDYPTAEEAAALFPSGATPFGGYDSTKYDFIHYDQIQWYKETSELLQENNNGEIVPGLMAFHIPLQETYTAWINRDGLEWTGEKKDPVCASAYNTGLFEVLRHRGDVKAVINGHDHVNDYMVNYCGIKLCYAGTLTNTTYHDETMWGTRVFVINESNPSDVQTYMSYLDSSEESKEETLPALSGTIADFEGTAPSLRVSGFDGAISGASVETIQAGIAAGAGINGSNALSVTRTAWAEAKSGNNLEVIWDLATPGTLGENKYLVVWLDLATNSVDFRKAGFGLLVNGANSAPYRTDEYDKKSPFYYKAEGSNEWVTLSTGTDGCFGAGDGCSVQGYKGWFALPLEYMLRKDTNASLDENSKITGLYFYMSLAASGMAGKQIYLDQFQLVADYTTVG